MRLARRPGVGRWTASLAAMTLALVVGSAAPSRADFHLPYQACSLGIGSAHVNLVDEAGTLVFTGSVYCPGGSSVSIDALTLTPVIPPGPPVPGNTPQGCVFPCQQPVVATGAAPSSPGVYRVFMAFTATGPGGTYTPSRKAGFVVTSSGTVVRACNDVSCPF